MSTCDYTEETWERIRAASSAAGWPSDWTVAERDQMEALADDANRELELYPVIHAWPTSDGSQLTFWCIHCKSHHVHGRHIGFQNYTARFGTHPLGPGLTQREFACSIVLGGRGFCTCPVGSGDGHRVAHCWKTDSAYYDYGYYLHEVPPNDARALQKPKRRARTRRR